MAWRETEEACEEEGNLEAEEGAEGEGVDVCGVGGREWGMEERAEARARSAKAPSEAQRRSTEWATPRLLTPPEGREEESSSSASMEDTTVSKRPNGAGECGFLIWQVLTDEIVLLA